MIQFIAVGRVHERPEIRETSSGLKYTKLLLDVRNGFNNEKEDTFSVTFWKNLAEECCNVEPGSLLAVRGRMQENNFTRDDGVHYQSDMIAEKFSCIQ